VTLRLYDTAAREIRDFDPVVPGKASLYLCGATVQAPPHIGHIRSGVSFDILRRWLTASGYEVTFCRNVTDIDDKIIRTAQETGVPWWAVAEQNQRAFTRAYNVLGCLPPDVEPRATGHVPEMIVLMRRLIEAGHAYAAGGDVYFDVSSQPDYGCLSGQRLEHMRPAGDTEGADAKRDPRDFALWKGHKPGEPSWETPWGPGRPGWHLECSAMATKYLGPTFDIHGGGLDLVFPHHENERAQSTAAGDGFARYWMHNGLVGIAGEKMSKSLGNSLLVDAMVTEVRPAELAADPAAIGPATDLAAIPVPFAAALDDDLGVPLALAVVHGAVHAGNAALAAGDSSGSAKHLTEVRAMLGVLGLDPLAEPWSAGGGSEGLREVISALVTVALDQRQAAKARKDYETADKIRDRLADAGITLEDTPRGTRWELGR